MQIMFSIAIGELAICAVEASDAVGPRRPEEPTNPRFKSFELCRVLVAVDDSTGNNERDFSSSIRGTNDGKFALDPGGPFTHTLQSEVSFAPQLRERRIDSQSVVLYAQ